MVLDLANYYMIQQYYSILVIFNNYDGVVDAAWFFQHYPILCSSATYDAMLQLRSGFIVH
jgi:hypothetical protein